MRKIISLLKAAMSQDMNLFKVESQKESRGRKVGFPIVISLMLMFSIGSLVYELAQGLAQFDLTYIIIPIFVILTTILTFIEAIYKSQGILFEAKDNDLLFSLPIPKSYIFFVRVCKMLSFQFLYNALFLIPTFVVYAMFEKVAFSFYFVAVIILILSPIIPTIIGSILGYIIKGIVSKSKSKKMVQTISTMLVLVAVLYVSFNINQMMNEFVQNADIFKNAIYHIYYPAAMYVKLIQEFNILDFTLILAMHIIPLIIFIYLFSLSYFKMLSRLSEVSTRKKKVIDKPMVQQRKWKVKSPMKALMIKELKRFFSSPVFVTNAGFSMVLVIIGTIALLINANSLVEKLIQVGEIESSVEQIMAVLPTVFYGFIVFASCMTSITSSMISLEGKSMNILKSLPIKEDKILLAKILASNSLSVPINIICSIVFCFSFSVSKLEIAFIITACIIVPTFSALIGILMNLKYPKMNATSDAEVVKQSMSSMFSVLIGMLVRRFFGCNIIYRN